jgi:TolA-binding protein
MDYQTRLSRLQFAKVALQGAQPDVVLAEKAYDQVIESADFSPDATQEDHRLTYDAYRGKLSLAIKNRGLAKRLASTMIEVFHKDEELAERALFDVAEAYIRMEEKDGATDLLLKFLRDYPRSQKFAEASFELGSIYHAQEKPAEAIPHYLTYLNKTKSDKRLVASFLSDCYLAVGDVSGATLVLEQYSGFTIEELRGR